MGGLPGLGAFGLAGTGNGGRGAVSLTTSGVVQDSMRLSCITPVFPRPGMVTLSVAPNSREFAGMLLHIFQSIFSLCSVYKFR